MNTDCAGLTVPEIQRARYPLSLLAWFEQQRPIATIAPDHGDYTRVYDIRDVNPPDSFCGGVPKAVWDGNTTVLATDYPDSAAAGSDSMGTSRYVDSDQPPRAVRATAEVVSIDGLISIGTVLVRIPRAPGTTSYVVANVSSFANEPSAAGLTAIVRSLR